MELLRPSSAGTDLSEADRLLITAETLHDAMLCPCGSGGPHYLDETSKVDGWHEGDYIYCDVKRAADQLRADEETPEPGAMPYVKDLRSADALES